MRIKYFRCNYNVIRISNKICICNRYNMKVYNLPVALQGRAMGAVRPGSTFRGVAKLRLYLKILKIWKGEKYLEGEKF